MDLATTTSSRPSRRARLRARLVAGALATSAALVLVGAVHSEQASATGFQAYTEQGWVIEDSGLGVSFKWEMAPVTRGPAAVTSRWIYLPSVMRPKQRVCVSGFGLGPFCGTIPAGIQSKLKKSAREPCRQGSCVGYYAEYGSQRWGILNLPAWIRKAVAAINKVSPVDIPLNWVISKLDGIIEKGLDKIVRTKFRVTVQPGSSTGCSYADVSGGPDNWAIKCYK